MELLRNTIIGTAILFVSMALFMGLIYLIITTAYAGPIIGGILTLVLGAMLGEIVMKWWW